MTPSNANPTGRLIAHFDGWLVHSSSLHITCPANKCHHEASVGAKAKDGHSFGILVKATSGTEELHRSH